MRKRTKYNRAGMTLVELLVALMVSSIIFTAVATLAFAMGNAQKDGDEQSIHQTQLRYATLRIAELLRYAKLTVLAGDDLALWRADDDLDGKIDPSELVYIETGAGRNHIYILDFPEATGEVLLAALKDGSAKTSLVAGYNERRVEVLPQCGNVVFEPATIDENTGFVGIGFDLDEAGATRHYEITANLRCR